MKKPAQIKLSASFHYAAEGIWYGLRTQRNLRLQCIAAIFAMFAAAFFHISTSDWATLLLVIALVIAMELTNTAIEVVVDFISPEWHALAKVAKDVAAGAVLTASLFSIVIGILIFYEPVILWLGWGS